MSLPSQDALESPQQQKEGRRRSLKELAYQDIKQRIMECRLQPGQQINESQLIKELGYGRTPTHQALHQLAHDKLVVIIPRKGVMVAPLSLNDVLETAEVRLACESLSASLAAERASQAEIDGIKDIVDATAELILVRDIPRLMQMDLRFHQAIAASTRNQVLVDMVASLHERQARFWFLALSEPEHLKDTYDEHSAILDALAARDSQAAAHAMETHIKAFQRTVTRTI